MLPLLRRPRPPRHISVGVGNPNPVQVRYKRGGLPKPGAATARSAQGFKRKEGGVNAFGGTKKEKRLGAFRPLPPAQLQDPVFESEKRAPLDLPVFRPEILTEDLSLGKALSFSTSEQDAMRIFGLPKNVLVEFRLLSKPYSVVRDVTLKTVDILDGASEKPSSQNRVVLTGPSGSGKSFALLQAVEYCSSKNWIVLYIPRSISLVDSSTPYNYDARTRTYLQPVYSYQLLQRLLTVNSSKLEKLQTSKVRVLGATALPAGTPLSDLVNVGIKDQNLAPVVLPALLSELANQETHPVLLALDDFQALYRRTTEYRNPRFECIKPYHLSIPRLLLQYSSGKKFFKRGAVLGALSETNTEFQPTLELKEALGLPHDRPVGPYVKRTPELIEYAKGLRDLPVPKLSVTEAASIFEVWARDKALHSVPTDELFLTKYAEAQGNARAFVWKGILSTMATT